MTRTAEIVKHVAEKCNYIWDSYDQGRWAHSIGWARNTNPHLIGHMNHSDWFRGWDAEANRNQTEAA